MISVIIESAGRTLLLAAAVWAALRLFRVGNVVAQKIAWTVVLAAAIAMPFLMRWPLVKVRPISMPASISGLWTKPVHRAVPARPVTSPPRESAQASEPITTTVWLAPAGFQVASAIPSSAAPVPRWTLPPLRTLVFIVYFSVSGILLLRLLLGVAMAFRLWSRAEPASVLVEPRADVRISTDISTPVTIGLGIVLPASSLTWSRHRLRVVLAHELAHVRQRDFYLQFLAHLHTAIFWFSPAAWWIQKRLSDLSEAISDFAGIAEARDATTYAELLLEVAAMPRRPIFAVPMARSSRIEHRIDRLLVERLFRRSFLEGRTRALTTAAVVPFVLAASASLIAVRAAERVAPLRTPILHVVAQDSNMTVTVPDAPTSAPALPVVPLRGVKPAVPMPAVEASSVSLVAQAKLPAPTVEHDRETNLSDSDVESDQDSFMIVSGDKSQVFNFQGDDAAMEAMRKKLHGSYILAERSGRYYVIDDPALVEQSRKLFAPMEELGRQQAALGAQQEKLGQEQERLGKLQEQAHIEVPDMSKEIAELQVSIRRLQDLQKNRNVTVGELAELQGHIGDIEGRLGEMQGRIGAKQGELGSQEGELGAKQGELGAKQGKLGEEQARLAARASRQMRAVIDQAFQSGKAKPVD